MSVPDAHHPCWQKLANGGLSRIKTEHLGTQLLAKRIERSTDPVGAKAADIHAFFARWERVLPGEIAQLTRV